MLKKDKFKIRNQLIKAVEAYKGIDGFTFFDTVDWLHRPKELKLDQNDTEVLLMNLSKTAWILLTTKCFYIGQDDTIIRINSSDIEDLEFENQKRSFDRQEAYKYSRLESYTQWSFSGILNIETKNKRTIKVNLPNHNFGVCLVNALRRLRFVTEKYEGI
ncbi:MAG: hypothetical protein KGZ87_04755 [Bacteroidetes bacterium]|nr:hypothetical protein [Bacteroidota bacterium]